MMIYLLSFKLMSISILLLSFVQASVSTLSISWAVRFLNFLAFVYLPSFFKNSFAKNLDNDHHVDLSNKL